MIIAVGQSDWNTLTPELCRQLQQLLPLESRELLATPDRLSAQNIRAIQTHIEHVWRALSAMVPRWVVEAIDAPATTAGRAGEATLLFADVTGFTPLTAQLEAFGRAGNEYLIDALNRFFAAIVPLALARGGDLLAFGGDAILVAFEGSGHVAAAVAAAWEMQQAIVAIDLGDLGVPNPPRLQMKIGLATGPLVLADVGADTRRIALALGSVLDTTDAMANATAPGGIRLDPRATELAAPVARLAPQPDGSALLIGLDEMPPAPPPAPAAAIDADLGVLAARSMGLGRYLPKSLLASVIAAPLAAPGSGEQRQVVSLFAHLTGLHELADALWDTQPGLVAAVANLVINRVLAVIEGAGGVLARVDIYGGGHKLLALFGAPVAHEQAAARAVITALTLRDTLSSAGTELAAMLGSQLSGAGSFQAELAPTLGIHTGINAGPVVAGLVGSPLRWEYTVMGDAVNIAARLMGKAGPGEVLASPQVRAAIGDHVDAEERLLQLKGRPEPVPVWSVRALGPEEHPPAAQNTPLVGREAEQAAFRQVGEALRSGQPAVVLVQGEAGIGKSRLVRELPAILGAGVTYVQTGSPGLVPVSFGVLRSLLLQVCRLAQEDPSAPALDQLRPVVDQLCPGRGDELWPALAVLLGLAEADLAGLGATAEAQQRLIAWALQSLLEAAAARQSLAWICEDLHEADDASLGVIEQLLAIGWQAPVLFCATLRTTAPTVDLAGRLFAAAEQRFDGHAIRIELGGLHPGAGDMLLDTLLPGLAPPTRAALQAHTAGNPLFLQALAQTVQQRQMLAPSSQGLALQGSLAALDVPRTLRELVAAQVDRLPPEVRRLAQVAAVIAVADRVVPLWLLEQVVDEPQALAARMRGLEQARIIAPEPDSPGERYVFHHALYQQAAYEQLLERERQELHRRAGLVLHSQRERHEARVEALAYHCYEGRSWELALDYSLAAARRARQAYANREARRLLRRALGLARRLGQPQREAEAREELGEIYTLTGRYAPARAHIERTLRSAADDTPAGLVARARRHQLLAEIAEAVGEYDRAEEVSRAGLRFAEQTQDAFRERLELHEQLAIILMRRGDLDAAEQICRDGLALLPPDSPLLRERVALMQLIGDLDAQRGNYRRAILALQDSLNLARSLNDPARISPILRNLGGCYHLIGQRKQAMIYYKESVDIDERVGNIAGQIRAVDNLGLVYMMNGDYDSARQCFDWCCQQAQAYNMKEKLANATTNAGWLQYIIGNFDQAKTILLSAYTLFAELGDQRNLAECSYLLGDVALATGDADVALRFGEQALDFARRSGCISHEAYSLRVIGEALLAQGQIIQSEAVLTHAQEVQTQIDDPFGQVLLMRACIFLLATQSKRSEAAHMLDTGLTLADTQDTPYLRAVMEQARQMLGTLETQTV